MKQIKVLVAAHLAGMAARLQALGMDIMVVNESPLIKSMEKVKEEINIGFISPRDLTGKSRRRAQWKDERQKSGRQR